MDLNSLKDQVSNLTLYDLKAGVRKVQNGKLKPEMGAIEYHDLNLFHSGDELYRDGGKGTIVVYGAGSS